MVSHDQILDSARTGIVRQHLKREVALWPDQCNLGISIKRQQRRAAHISGSTGSQRQRLVLQQSHRALRHEQRELPVLRRVHVLWAEALQRDIVRPVELTEGCARNKQSAFVFETAGCSTWCLRSCSCCGCFGRCNRQVGDGEECLAPSDIFHIASIHPPIKCWSLRMIAVSTVDVLTKCSETAWLVYFCKNGVFGHSMSQPPLSALRGPTHASTGPFERTSYHHGVQVSGVVGVLGHTHRGGDRSGCRTLAGTLAAAVLGGHVPDELLVADRPAVRRNKAVPAPLVPKHPVLELLFSRW